MCKLTELVSVDLENALGISILPVMNASDLFKSKWSRFAVSQAIGFFKVNDGGEWTIIMEGETIESLKGSIEEQKENIRLQRARVAAYVEPVTVNPRGPAEYRKEFD